MSLTPQCRSPSKAQRYISPLTLPTPPPSKKSSGAKTQCADLKKNQVTDRQQVLHHPHYIAEHLGDPCTFGALDHLLQCGHKVITRHAETCANNCQPPTSPFVNPKSIDRPFVCMACITQRMNVEHEAKLGSFIKDMQVVAEKTEKCDAAAWVAEKAIIMGEAWRESEFHQIGEDIGKARFCYAPYVGEDHQEAYATLVSQMEQARVDVVTKSCSNDKVEQIRRSSRTMKKPPARCITLM